LVRARNAAISASLRGRKVLATSSACFKIFMLSIPVITTDVGSDSA